MERDYDREIEPVAPRIWLRILILLLVAFVAGAIAMGWMLTHWGAAQRYLRQADPVAPIPLVMPRPLAPPPLPAVRPPAPAALDDRLQLIETRVEQIDRRARAATGNADRAEGLLVAFAARRALDRGVDLGYIEGLLRERFGRGQPQAVATIISAAHLPVTIEELQSGLDEVAPSLIGEGPRENWWDAFRREMSGLIVVRRAGTVSTAPPDRVERAQRALEIGRVDLALAEVSRLPGRAAAASWIVNARRYTASRAALDQIETAALLDPEASPQATGAWAE